MSDLADMMLWPEKQYREVRLIGPVFSVCNIWFTIGTPRKPQGVSIPKQCLDHDGATDKMVTEICPYRASNRGRESKSYYVNAIDREEQEGRDYPVAKTVRKEEHLDHLARWCKVGDSRKTPVRLLEIPDSQIDRLKGFKKLNKIKHPRTGEVVYKDISDERFGRNISIMFDGEKKGPARYDITIGDRAPITDEEREYLLYRPDLLKPGRLDEAKREMADLDGKIIEKPKANAKPGERPARTGNRRDLDDPLMDDDTVRMDDDDGYARPRRASRDMEEDERPSRGRTRSRDDELDGYERPKRTSRLDAELDDDFAEEKPKRRAAREDDDEEPVRRGRPAAREDDDERPRRRPAAEEPEEPVRKKRRPPEDEDEDFDRRRVVRTRRPADDDEDEAPPRHRARAYL